MTNHLLAIAINSYSSVTKLNNCVRDVENIIDVLTSDYDFDKSNVTKLYDKDATGNNILTSLEDHLARQSNAENLLIVFSGHGDFDSKLDLGYFIPVEAILYNKSTYIPNTTIFNYIKAFQYRHVVILSDTCFSGSLFAQYRSLSTALDKLYDIPSKWALSSGRVEIVSDGIPGDNSPFALSIINNLKTNTADFLSMAQLSRQVMIEVGDKNIQLPQGGPLQQLGDKGGEFLFKKRAKKFLRKSVKSDEQSSGEFEKLINEYYDYSNQIEEAENSNKQATKRRLTEELGFTTKFIDREVIKLLQLEKSNILSSTDFKKIFGEDIEIVLKELGEITEEKNLAVRSQKFDEAVNARDKEKAIQNRLLGLISENKVVISHNLALTEESIKKDFALLSVLTDILPVYYRTRLDNLIEKGFSSILFLKYSKDFGHVSHRRFFHAFTEFTEKVIPEILSHIFNSDKEKDASTIPNFMEKFDWIFKALPTI